MKPSPRLIPWLVVSAAALYLVGVMWPRSDGAGLHLRELGRSPVHNGGRVMPFSSVARSSLAFLTSGYTQHTVKDKTTGRTLRIIPANQWLLEVLAIGVGDRRALDLEVFRIDNDQVLHILGLEPRVGFRYSIDEIRPRFKELLVQAQQAKEKDAKERSLLDNKVLETTQKLTTFINLAEHKGPFTIPPLSKGDEWKPLSAADADSSAANQFVAMLEAYKDNETAAFNKSLAQFHSQVLSAVPADATRARFEDYFNAADPFWHCLVLYLVAFLLAAGSWIGWSKPLSQSAFYLCCLVFAVHTAALGMRMYLLDRPFVFVTNLYSSAVFIAWGCALIALILEKFIGLMMRTSSFGGIGTAVASIAGFLSLVVARLLSLTVEDTMSPPEAVLDTNFWLATHVTTITFGYAATFVAGFFGILYIIFGVFTKVRDREIFPVLGRIIYGVVCFATLLSFTGTVLGGIWADQSWGRFWGWDPKENGALIIVLWNALILHARWGGLIKHRGIAVASVMGNIVTAWSWFGVNILGVGLHSYGFSKETLIALISFVGFNLVVIGLGMLPKGYWASYSKDFFPPQFVPSPGRTPPARDPRRKPADVHVTAE